MTVVKAGCVPGSVLSGRCDRCQCEVECNREEVELMEKDVNDDSLADYWVDCPTEGCRSRIFFWRRWD